jgi:dTDP-glucose 4,6-dehydratase
MKTYLITGGAGFIGSNFIHYLYNKFGDEIRIINIDNLTYAGNLANLEKVKQNKNYFFYKNNICDKAEIANIFAKHKPDYIVHFAAESHVDRSIKDSREFILTNVLGTQVLLDCLRYYPVQKFIHISTDEVYGSLKEGEKSFTEENILSPNSPYSASKAASDLMVRSYYKTYDLPLIITRCSNNYGPYQFPEKLIPLMITNALENKKLPVYGQGLNIRDWLYVEDHCSAVEAIINKGRIGEIYNIGGDNQVNNIDMVKTIIKELGKNENLIEFVKDRPGHDFRYAMNYQKLYNETGWQPKVGIKEGLKKTIKWYEGNKSWWQKIKTGEYLKYYETQYKNGKDAICRVS